jgi:hypothetical protein
MRIEMAKKENRLFELVLRNAILLPGVSIKRKTFLQNELSQYCPEEKIKDAIENSPAYAGIDLELINNIARKCIIYETNKVSAFSFAAGIPGGVAMIITVPLDLMQYFGHILRVIQKLIYLYGWPELLDDEGTMDANTKNLLILFMGAMFGVGGAAEAISVLAESMARKASRDIANKSLAKGTAYPIVKKIADIMGAKMTKDIFAKGAAKIIPLLGGVISGGLTYITFKPMANRLQKNLSQFEENNNRISQR